MGALLTILFCLSLIACAYFLLRFIISVIFKQSMATYKKKLVVSAIILAVSLIGITMITTLKEQPVSKREKSQIDVPAEGEKLYEQKTLEERFTEENSITQPHTSTPPKEPTPEEKAAKEAEKKAAEEKRIAEQQVAAERKAQEEAPKQAERQAEEERRASLLENGVQLEYTFEKLSEHKYKVVVTTNLPEGMKLSITLGNRWLFRRQVMGISDDSDYIMTSAESKYLKDNTFEGNAKREVRNGTFEVTFGENKNLVPGEYEFEIISLLTSLQPKEIQPILGKNGANLFGTGVIEDKTFGGEKHILLVETIYLP